MYHPYPYLTYHTATPSTVSPILNSATVPTSATLSDSNGYHNGHHHHNHHSTILAEDYSSFSPSKKYLASNGNARPGVRQHEQSRNANSKYIGPNTESPDPTSANGSPLNVSSPSNGSPTENTSNASTKSDEMNKNNGRVGSAIDGQQCDHRDECSSSDMATDALYVSANCVLFTYYHGDVSSAVDEHISKALNQSNGYRDSTDSNKEPHSNKEFSPMSQRDFPPSFWNSNYYMTFGVSGQGPPSLNNSGHHAADLSTFPTDPYHHHHHHHHHHHPTAGGTLHGLHHQPDPWPHYSTLPSPYARSGMQAASIHDLAAAASYSAVGMNNVPPPPNAATSRYPSLLIQPSMRSGRLAPSHGQCGSSALSKPEATAAWGAHRYHHDPLTNELSSHLDTNYNSSYGTMGAMTGIDGPGQDSTKDLYWF
ncbi:VGLL2 (predicted) [Pycnogonum litorale]